MNPSASPPPVPDGPGGAAAPGPSRVRPKRKPATSARAVLRRERQRVAQTLHNGVCQELTGICLMASAAAGDYRVRCPEAEQKLREIARLVQRAGAGLQEFVHTLRPPDR